MSRAHREAAGTICGRFRAAPAAGLEESHPAAATASGAISSSSAK